MTNINKHNVIYMLLIGVSLGLTAQVFAANNTAESGNVVANLQQTDDNTDNNASEDNLTESALALHAESKTIDNNYNRFFVNLGVGGGGYLGSTYVSGPAFSLNFGYNFNDIFAIEAGWTGITANPFLDGGASIGGLGLISAANLNSNLYDVAFRSTYHISRFFSIYGKVGGAIDDATWSQSSPGALIQNKLGDNVTAFDSLLGGGMSVDLWHISLFGELDQFNNLAGGAASTPTSYFGLLFGIQYNF